MSVIWQVVSPAPDEDWAQSGAPIQNDGELDEESSDDLGHSNAAALQVQAVVSAVGPGTVTLTVGTQSLTVNLPAVTSVQVLVDGKEVDTLAGHVDLRRPLAENLAWVQ